MYDFERAYRKAALDLATVALERIANETALTPEQVRGLAALGIEEAKKWDAKANLEQSENTQGG